MLQNIVKKPIVWFLWLALLASGPCNIATAQQNRRYPGVAVSEGYEEISGRVMSSQGGPVDGAYVLIKGTNIGSATDDKGRFIMIAPEDDYILITSCLGYTTRTVKEDKSSIIILQPEVLSLDEVVVQLPMDNSIIESIESIPGVLGDSRKIALTEPAIDVKGPLNSAIVVEGFPASYRINGMKSPPVVRLLGLAGTNADSAYQSITVDRDGSVICPATGTVVNIKTIPWKHEYQSFRFEAGVPFYRAGFGTPINRLSGININATGTLYQTFAKWLRFARGTELPAYHEIGAVYHFDEGPWKIIGRGTIVEEGTDIVGKEDVGKYTANAFASASHKSRFRFAFLDDSNELMIGFSKEGVHYTASGEGENGKLITTDTDLGLMMGDITFIRSMQNNLTRIGASVSGEYGLQKRIDTDAIGETETEGDKQEAYQAGVFIVRSFPIAPAWTAEAGLRLDQLHGNYAPSLTAKVNHYLNKYMLWASAARLSDFSIKGAFHTLDYSPMRSQNKFETLNQVRVGASYVRDVLVADASAFFKYLQDLESYGRIGDGNAMGIELMLKYGIRINTQLNLALQRATVQYGGITRRSDYDELVSGNLLLHIPIYQFFINSNVSFGTGRPYTPVELDESEPEPKLKRIRKNSGNLPGYAAFDLAVGQSFIVSGYNCTTQLSVTDLLGLLGLEKKIVAYSYRLEQGPEGSSVKRHPLYVPSLAAFTLRVQSPVPGH